MRNWAYKRFCAIFSTLVDTTYAQNVSCFPGTRQRENVHFLVYVLYKYKHLLCALVPAIAIPYLVRGPGRCGYSVLWKDRW